MKKLFLFCALLMVFSSCQKDITNTHVSATGVEKVMQTPSKENMDLKKNGDPSLSFEKLNAKVKVENGILVFETPKDWSKTISFLRNATPIEVAKWEKSLNGFQSVYRNYVNAKNELIETDNIELVKAKYQGKVKFDSENSIEQFIRNGKIFGSIINEKGEYRVGKTIVAYYNGNVISIVDGDRRKLEDAKLRLVSDISSKVFIHKLTITPSSTSLGLRSCGNGTAGCPIEIQQTINSANNNFRIRIHYDLKDNSNWVSNSDTGFDEFTTDIFFDIDVDHERKRWYGWAGDRSGFTWGFGWGLSLVSQQGTRGACCGAVFGWSQGGWTWNTDEAFFNVGIPILNDFWSDDPNLNADLVATIFNGWKLCLGRTGLVAHSNLTGNNHVDNEQFCWSDTNM